MVAESQTNAPREARGIRALQGGIITPRMILAFMLAIVLFVAGAVMIVWTRNQIVQLGYEINNANVAVSNLKQENMHLINERYEFINLRRLENAAAELGLAKPSSGQIIVFHEKETGKKKP